MKCWGDQRVLHSADIEIRRGASFTFRTVLVGTQGQISQEIRDMLKLGLFCG